MAAVIVFIVITMLLLFVAMVLAAISASNAEKGKKDPNAADTAWKYAMITAVVCGISVAVLIVILILYINSSRIATAAHGALGRAQERIYPYTGMENQ